MRDSNGFDLWAKDYDRNVKIIEDSGKYPFDGYKNILNSIYNSILSKPRAKVLDIGFGTAPISSILYKEGYEIWGQDFSQKMLEIAQSKMPDSRLFLKDFSDGLDDKIKDNKFDFIIATYCMHHLLDNDYRIAFMKELLGLLNKDGKLLIGDVMFQNLDEQEFCKKDVGDIWDDKENYYIVDDIKKAFPEVKFEKMSYCAGILELSSNL
jgi:putative AdoMet-dependent methyltransferase